VASAAPPGPSSALLYCHDSYGIGHLKRTCRIAQRLSLRWPALAQLIVTSSTSALASAGGDGVDYVKLPSVRRVPSRDGDSGYIPRVLPIPAAEQTAMRRDMLLGIVRHFRPDLVVVDHTPAGLDQEMTPSLHHLRASAPGTRFVAGIRDIVGDPARVREAWARDGVHALLEDLYDVIFVYGELEVFDLAAEIGLAARAAAKVRYTGYLGRDAEGPTPTEIRDQLGLRTGPLVLVTAGGGADGAPVLEPMLDALRRWPEQARFDCVLVGGPLMASGERRRLAAMLPSEAPVRFLDHVDDLGPYVAAADVLVSRGGYNTVCEILSFGRPAIIVPREMIGSVVDREQLLRARMLEQRGLAHVIRERDLTGRRLLETLNAMLEAPGPARQPLRLDGLSAVAAELESLLSREGG
jgi:predicted glycosyltransferase